MITDSGNRRSFDTGAVRDVTEGKGRMDLMPLDVIGDLYTQEEGEFFDWIGEFINTNDVHYLYCAFDCGAELIFGDINTAILEVAIHMEEGCKKYGDRNWEMGMPLHNYINSCTRHYTKWLRRDTDENHNRATLWNVICAIWTMKHHPELNDMPNAPANIKANCACGGTLRQSAQPAIHVTQIPQVLKMRPMSETDIKVFCELMFPPR